MSEKLSTESYKGTRDFYPEDQRVQNYIFSTMRKAVEKFGFVEYGASILEETALYRAKSGSEIVNEQTYSFTDRGGRDVTIRPEMTPTVARMVAKKRQELGFPLRWYSIPNLFRYERPQRGRLREHWQLNCDIFGADSIDADVEIVTVAHSIMKEFGAKSGDYIVRVNNRILLNFVLHDYLSLDADKSYQLTKLIDRKDKISAEDFQKEAGEIVGEKLGMLREYIEAKSVGDLPETLKENAGAKNIEQVMSRLEESGVSGLKFDPSLVRGFDYYTGLVFEFFDTSPENNRSLFGGGRYDDLVGIFDVEKVPAVGFGMGDVTIRDFLETHGLMPKLESTTKVQVCVLDNVNHESENLNLKDAAQGSSFMVQAFANKLASQLRSHNINVAIDYTGRKLDKQIKTAEKQNIPFIIVIGEDEANTGMFKLKNLETREEAEVTLESVINLLK